MHSPTSQLPLYAAPEYFFIRCDNNTADIPLKCFPPTCRLGQVCIDPSVENFYFNKQATEAKCRALYYIKQTREALSKPLKRHLVTWPEVLNLLSVWMLQVNRDIMQADDWLMSWREEVVIEPGSKMSLWISETHIPSLPLSLSFSHTHTYTHAHTLDRTHCWSHWLTLIKDFFITQRHFLTRQPTQKKGKNFWMYLCCE